MDAGGGTLFPPRSTAAAGPRAGRSALPGILVAFPRRSGRAAGGGGGERAGAGRRRAAVEDADRHVGARVRERRLAIGLTQQEPAGLAAITFQQVYKHEKGINRIAAGRRHAIARALGVEPGDLFEGLGGVGPARLLDGQRRLLELTRNFAALSRRHRKAVAGADRGDGSDGLRHAPGRGIARTDA